MRYLVSAVVLALTMTACGGAADEGPSAAEVSAIEAAALEAEESAAAEAERKASEERREAQEEARVARLQAEYDKCVTKTQPLIDALQQISSRLNVGLNYDEYGDYIGDAQVAYDAVFEGPNLPLDCLQKVAVGLEFGLNNHIDVLNIWGDCISDLYCDFNEGAPNDSAQKKWAGADRVLVKAKRGLAGLKP